MEEEGELGSTCRGDDPPEAAMPEEKVGGASRCCAVGDDPPEAAMPEGRVGCGGRGGCGGCGGCGGGGTQGDDPSWTAMPKMGVCWAECASTPGDDPPEAAMPEEKEEPGAGRLRVQFRGTKQNSICKNSRSTASGGPIL